jgi:uncharacterized protein (DUF427 family)
MAPTNMAHGQQFRSFEPPRPFIEPSPRHVRVKFGGTIVADSKHPLLLCRYGPGTLPGYLPTYYFPQEDVRMDTFEACTPAEQGDPVDYRTIRIGDHVADHAAWIVRQPPSELPELLNYVSFRWEQMDAWYEEEDEVFVHARDPYKRVDVLASARYVQVMLDGVTLADTRRPFLLFETSLPTRFYIPREDVRMNLLTPTTYTSRCPYKGVAQYWSADVDGRTVDNIVWSYPDPIPENPRIKELLCFFNERVDLVVDGRLLPRPQSPWSDGGPESTV